ncbi:hypothetical protein BU25DRAFT_274411 [Macroventuria anomochaeta]|uniref:Uncharacterized protein n=1 Tax=Macroventuria anomochaeta TaxID=301207 RepID=A0ACB6S8F5_9PLEO|nr:uncharacterized protein BU25DRAFT_274411 [Macroventuria anomochaeta]KAF2629802.1 hypothetical protein BU25DRAFT_274411 [Macroventuria anomochaeta]
MFFRRLASSGQPHLLILHSVIARKSSSLTSIASVDCPPEGKVWVAYREPNWLQIGAFCVSSRTSSFQHHAGTCNAGGDEARRFSRTTRGRQGQIQGVIEPRCHSCCKIGWILL